MLDNAAELLRLASESEHKTKGETRNLSGERSAVKRKFFVESYGCQMNVHDAERMAGLLESDGMDPAASVSDADLVVLNTCSVRERAEDKLFTRLGEIREEAGSRRPVVAVTGCVAQQEGRALLGHGSGVTVVVGTQAMKELPALAQARTGGAATDVRRHQPVRGRQFPAGCRPAVRSGPRLRDHHRGLQRFLQLLRRPLHARARTDAACANRSWRKYGKRRERAP